MTRSAPSDYRRHQKGAWNALAAEYGATDPLSAVISRGDPLTNYYFDKTTKSSLGRTVTPQREWTVVDIGCGVGRLTEWLAGQVREVVGIDIADEMLEVARQRAHSLGIRNVSFRLSDGLTLPIDPNTADLVICSSVLKYVMDDGDLANLVSAISQVAKPTADIIVIDQMDAAGPIRLGSEDIAGASVVRAAREYVRLFEQQHAALVNHHCLYRSRVLRRYQAAAGITRFDRCRNLYAFVFRRLADLDVLLDSLLKDRLPSRGFSLLHFRKVSEAPNSDSRD